MQLRNTSIVVLAVMLGGLGACSERVSVQTENPHETSGATQRERLRDQYGTIHGGEGIVLFDTSRRGRSEDGVGGGGMAVNTFLWRAALETIDFMPLAQTDPFGGVIITDWYSPPEAPDERFKLNVYVRDRELRADGLKVALFRQARGENGAWLDAPVEPAAATAIEDDILTRARELRIASLGPAQ